MFKLVAVIAPSDIFSGFNDVILVPLPIKFPSKVVASTFDTVTIPDVLLMFKLVAVIAPSDIFAGSIFVKSEPIPLNFFAVTIPVNPASPFSVI